MKKYLKTSGLLVAFLLSACADQALTNSGHIRNFHNLKPVEVTEIERHKSTEDFVVANAGQRVFQNIIVAPLRYNLSADAEEELTEEDRADLAEYFDESVREELEGFPLISKEQSNYPIASYAVLPNAYYVELVVTDANGAAAWFNIALTATVALPFDTGGITVEATIRDVATQEEVAAFRGFREGTMFHIWGGFTEYGHAEGGLDDYAVKVKELLEKFQCHGCVPTT